MKVCFDRVEEYTGTKARKYLGIGTCFSKKESWITIYLIWWILVFDFTEE